MIFNELCTPCSNYHSKHYTQLSELRSMNPNYLPRPAVVSHVLRNLMETQQNEIYMKTFCLKREKVKSMYCFPCIGFCTLYTMLQYIISLKSASLNACFYSYTHTVGHTIVKGSNKFLFTPF